MAYLPNSGVTIISASVDADINQLTQCNDGVIFAANQREDVDLTK